VLPEYQFSPKVKRGLCEEKPMQSKSIIWIGVFIGSTIGSLIPGLWGDDMFSYSSVLLGGIGALVGLWIGFKMST
jgi:dipeptide/tripeptide permease